MSEAEKPFAFPDELRIVQVETVVKALRAWLADHPGGSVDAGAVTSVDAAGLQVIVSLGRLAEQGGPAVRFRTFSPAVTEAADTLGIPLPSVEEAAA